MLYIILLLLVSVLGLVAFFTKLEKSHYMNDSRRVLDEENIKKAKVLFIKAMETLKIEEGKNKVKDFFTEMRNPEKRVKWDFKRKYLFNIIYMVIIAVTFKVSYVMGAIFILLYAVARFMGGKKIQKAQEKKNSEHKTEENEEQDGNELEIGFDMLKNFVVEKKNQLVGFMKDSVDSEKTANWEKDAKTFYVLVTSIPMTLVYIAGFLPEVLLLLSLLFVAMLIVEHFDKSNDTKELEEIKDKLKEVTSDNAKKNAEIETLKTNLAETKADILDINADEKVGKLREAVRKLQDKIKA